MDIVDRWLAEQEESSTIVPERQQPFIGVQSPGFVDIADVSGDAPDCGQEIDQFLTSRGNTPSGIDLDGAMKKLMFMKEKKEHPTLDDAMVMQIVEDHFDSGDY